MGGPGAGAAIGGGGAPPRDLGIPGAPDPPRAINFCSAPISWSGGKDLSSGGSVERIWKKWVNVKVQK